MRRFGFLIAAAALVLGVQVAGPVSAGSVEAEAAPTTVTGWWPVDPVTVHPRGVVSVPVRVKTGTQFVVRQVQVQRRRAGTAAWLTVTSAVTAADGRYTARLFAPAGVWQFRLVVPASAAGMAAETLPRSVTVLRAETISSGEAHTCALDATGKAWCWGLDEYGQLGDGSVDRGHKWVPVAVAGGRTFATISAGWGHTCAVDTGGKAWCWGYDFFGTVGDGAANRSPKHVPVAVAGGHQFATISADWHTCAVAQSGKPWCWGPDGYGQAGDGAASQSPKHAPTAVDWNEHWSHRARTISAGYHHTCATNTAGAAWCWGSDASGQIGDGDDDQGNEYSPKASITAMPRVFSTIAAGEGHTCAVDGAGQAWCWGLGDSGQLGIGSLVNRYAAAAVVGGHAFTTITAGAGHTCGVDSSNKAWCWGADWIGQIGDGGGETEDPQLVPIAVSGNRSFKTITAGLSHTCSVDTDGRAWCWGNNGSGQAGVGAETGPFRVPAAVAGGHTFHLPN